MGWSTESPRLRLVALSFLMLFLELALIRWVGSNVLYLSYFSNFILLASFLGIGLGFLRANSGRDLFRFAPIALAALVGFVRLFPVEIDRSGTELIFFGALGTRTGLPPFVTLPLLFLGVAGVMMLVGEGVARTFRQFPPLEAYRLDILGSLAGIIAFSLLGFLEAPPVVWGAVVAVGLFMLIDRRSALWQVPALAIMLTVLGLESVVATDSWSPYYKIRLIPQPSGAITLLVNGIPHQTIEAASRKLDVVSIYGIPYTRMRATPNNVLIVGAGTGDDVAIALRLGARHVDAVEIDPRIHTIGVQLNPDRAFQDPRVTSFVNDGRAFLEQTTRRYDLILFALPDSLTLVAGQSSLRLESYLFTAEAMQAARRHLTPEGAFGEYNYYREQWLIDRLAGTLQQVYGRAPCVDSVGEFGRLAVLMASSSATALQCPATWQPASPTTPPPATDDYPFLYLQARTIPDFYLLTLALILASALLLVRLSAGTLGPMGRYLDLFCMGAAFLLLETKNVVQFALLFGTTWFVNSLVFVGILLAVYLAIEVARRVDLGPSWRLYLALLVALAVAWLVQPELLLKLAVVPRFVVAIVIAFAPVFLANLVFARRFRDVSASNLAFAANLLGAMVGGVLEYASLLTGYRALLILIAVLYAGAFALQRFQARRLVRLA
ncbi:MAG: spermidine synthase [Chloroflexi bacterium]|nr:MAG: spermidine synthase [Chloroflexota bacterium]